MAQILTDYATTMKGCGSSPLSVPASSVTLPVKWCTNRSHHVLRSRKNSGRPTDAVFDISERTPSYGPSAAEFGPNARRRRVVLNQSIERACYRSNQQGPGRSRLHSHCKQPCRVTSTLCVYLKTCSGLLPGRLFMMVWPPFMPEPILEKSSTGRSRWLPRWCLDTCSTFSAGLQLLRLRPLMSQFPQACRPTRPV